MALVSLPQYANKVGRAPKSVRDMVSRGGLKTAVKIGRNWLIDEAEPYPDRRFKKTSSTNKEKDEG